MRAIKLLPILFTALFADAVVPQSASDLSITIYNDNRAFVHDIRQAKVDKGDQRLVYEGVAGSVITASVVPAFTGIPTRLFSQNYIYDLISLDSMLKKSVGRTVDFYTNGDDPTLSRGTLLAASPVVMVRQEKTGKILALDKPTQVIFHTIPKNMITRPSLVWHIQTAEAGTLGVDLKYLTTGVSWKSDYVLDLNDQSLDLVGWITVNNRSGVTYPDAKITCLAGEVHRARPIERRKMFRAMEAMPVAAPDVQEEAFSGYHIYKIPFRETLANNQQKQIRFIEKSGVGYTRYGKALSRNFRKNGKEKLKFLQIVTFANTEKNRMGIPLPAGIVRMYQKDGAAESRFIGESRIDNTPKGEKVELTVGTLFDVTGEKTVTRYIARKGYMNAQSTYTLHNRGKTDQTLKIEERIPTYGENIHFKTDCSDICSSRKLTAFVREYTIRLAGESSYTFTTEFEVYY